ncbi:MAG: peptide/nickel transport system permease protein [Thermomicrobiales bacterium]|nr:peptide/nickel transport system permease protein [Thermomicrobiales bacterium]
MTSLIVRRLLQMIPLLIGVSFLTFAIVNLVPGSPISSLQFNPRTRPEDIERIRENLGLDRPWYERYFVWLSDVARGDLGLSLTNSTPVRDRLLGVLPNTLLLTGASLTLALAVAVPLGVLSAVRRNSIFDHVTTILATTFSSIPAFWLALLMIILFSDRFRAWGWPALPINGTYDLHGNSGVLDRIEHLILPASSLALVQIAGWTRFIRSAMLESIRQDYVRTAEAKGLPRRAVVYSHAFRNALIPLVTLVGLALPELFGGAYLIEQIFAWNGAGRLTYQAAQSSDYTLIMGATLMFATLTMLGNLAADILYAVADPRIRYD